MQVKRGVSSAIVAAALVAACGEGTATRESHPVDAEACDGAHGSGSGSGSALNACDNGSDACGSNAACRSCLDEAGCAEGPDPVWTGSECVCADTPEHCQYTFCCATGWVWNPGVCACIPPP